MKTLSLNALSVQEMTVAEMQQVDGGNTTMVNAIDPAGLDLSTNGSLLGSLILGGLLFILGTILCYDFKKHPENYTITYS